MSVLNPKVKTLLTNSNDFLSEAEFKSIIEDNLTLLETDVEAAIYKLLKNEILKQIFSGYIISKLPHDKKLETDIYESVTSKIMSKFINVHKDRLNGLALKELLISGLDTKLNNRSRVSFIIYETIYDYIYTVFNHSIIQNMLILFETDVELAIHKLLTDKIIKELFTLYIQSNFSQDKKLEMGIYESVTSKTMLKFINDYKDRLNILELKELLISGLDTKLHNKSRVSFIIYETIYNYIYNLFKDDKNKTYIVLESSKNSERSEFIEDLGISNYEQIYSNFENFVVYPKASASYSVIMSADLRTSSSKRSNNSRALTILNKPKLFFKIYDSKLTSLNIEKKIYEQVFKLVQYNITPNILCKIGISNNLFDFYESFEGISPKLKSELDIAINGVSGWFKKREAQERTGITPPTWTKTNLIITQKGDISLFHLLLKNTLTITEIKEILFQILYTLYVFEQIEFSHGDLHEQNIMINTLSEPIHLYYKISGQMYKISTRYAVKIYDFDHATIFKSTRIRVNSKYISVDNVENIQNLIGITNRFNKNIDKIKLLLHILSYPILKDILSEFIGQVFPGLTSEETIYETYSRLLPLESNVTEANRVFGGTLEEGVTPEFIKKYYKTSDYLCKKSWKNYFEYMTTPTFQNFIPKNGTLDNTKDDHLWLPDEIISSSESMISKSLFTEFQNSEPINVRQHPVYTIEGRLYI
jgi:hypothetical protein